MKVLIHALGADVGGAVRHLSNFLPALSESKSVLGSKPQYFIVVRSKIPTPPPSKNITFIKVPNFFGSNAFLRLGVDNLFIPLFLKLKGIDTLVTLFNFGPLWGARNHINFQTDATYYSRWYFHQLSPKNKIVFLLRKFYIFLILNRANKIIVPSNSMFNSITENFAELEVEKFTVLPLGIAAHETDVTRVSKKLFDLLGKSTINFFYPTRIGIYKGFDVLLRALGKLKRIHGYQFRCLLPFSLEDWPEGSLKISTILRQEGLQDEVIFLGGLSHQEMDYVYRKATVVVYASLVESFCFPLAEALSHHLPVIASDTPINHEMCQNAALYYPPHDSEAMADQLKAVFDAETRKKLSQEAKSQFESRDWSWETYAREFEKLL